MRYTHTKCISLSFQIGNEIGDTLLRPPRPLKDQLVELSVKLRGETYNDALRDPSSFHYQQLAKQFTRRVSMYKVM